MSWPTHAPTADVNPELVEPELKQKWDEFVLECERLGVSLRNIQYSMHQDQFGDGEMRAFVQAEVQRLGEDYGDVFWHGNLDHIDSWGNTVSDEDGSGIVYSGWGGERDMSTVPTARPGSPYSDRGLDKVGWFQVIATRGSIRVDQGLRCDDKVISHNAGSCARS